MPKLTLDTLLGHDTDAPDTGRKERWLRCPLPACRERQEPTDRVLRVDTVNGIWCCHRCQAGGVLSEWKDTWRAPSRRPTTPATQPPATQTTSEPPEWTEADQAAYEAAQAEIAGALPEADLIEWLWRHWGCALGLDERGKLKAKDAGQVPMPVRAIIAKRQEGLAILLKMQAQPQLSLD